MDQAALTYCSQVISPKKGLLALTIIFSMFALDAKVGSAAIQLPATFSGTVPFSCEFSGGSDNVEMSYTRNNDQPGVGGTGLLMGTSEPLSIESNKVPRLGVTLNSVLVPRTVSFRGVWLRSLATNRTIQNATSSSLGNDPIATIIPSSKLIENDYVVGQQNDVTLTVSATLRNSYPYEVYQFDVVLTCLDS